MSFRSELLEIEPGQLREESYCASKSEQEVLALFHEIMREGVHGFCFSPYENHQEPGHVLTEAQIERRLTIIHKHSQWVRSFSCTEGNELIPEVAKRLGMKTLVGAWLGSDKEKNRIEIDGLISLMKKGVVDIAGVGNEVLYRKDLTEAELLEYIAEVKTAVPNVPVGYIDAYYEFVQKPALSAMCDIILCNCYPFWEGTDFNHSLSHMKSMFASAKRAGQGKPILVTETGWPSNGQSVKQSHPSMSNALRYFVDTQLWAKEQNIGVFYFSSFDEAWKVGPEGDVGAHWGIWNSSEQLKF
jgi:glucan 1,3-beta-glucosidase